MVCDATLLWSQVVAYKEAFWDDKTRCLCIVQDSSDVTLLFTQQAGLRASSHPGGKGDHEVSPALCEECADGDLLQQINKCKQERAYLREVRRE